MADKHRLTAGTHRRPGRPDEVFEAGDVFEPTDRELAQNADRMKKVGDEPGVDAGATPDEVTAGDDEADGWPEGYTYEKRGMWVYLTSPSGDAVESDRPSGAWKGTDEAQEAAWKHAAGD